jgi:UDP-2-acetamido-3-amino-2,3-dideoxy-glucuronate N-acetyltransferase
MKIHPLSDVQSKMIGTDTVIWQYSIVLPGAVIGNNCNINSHCFIENDVTIGNNVTVKCGVYIWDGITIGNDVHIGPNVTFTNDIYPRSKHNFQLARTVINHGASIGANSTIIAGITVGEFAMIGAGSVVTKNIPNNTLWMGNPARQTAYICNCGHKLDEKMHCCDCDSDYNLIDNCIMKNYDKISGS